MENYRWAENDYAPRGTAETILEPNWTFRIDANGNISAYLPEEIRFRDGEHWRPVCPFFEVHGRFSDGEEGPLDSRELGVGLDKVTWAVHAANRKAFHYTLAEGDHVDARLEIRGDDHRKTELRGVSPNGASEPLVPAGMWIPLGHAQAVRPNPGFPELRLRITPPQGLIYAPTNTRERDLSALLPANWKPEDFLRNINTILNPDAAWPLWAPNDGDSRTNPGGLYAQTPDAASLGFLDDSNDGVITVRIELPTGTLTASARYTCCPPDFQPDRRPFVSVADGLADQEHRGEVLEPHYVEAWAETEAEVADFMQRVRETMEASNLDHQNLRSQLANQGMVPESDALPFTPQLPRPGHPLPLLELGRANHARFLAYDVFKQRMGQRPELLEKWIRVPTAPPGNYDHRMPALMRGSDSYPMVLTQRQYDLLRAWLEEVRKNAPEVS